MKNHVILLNRGLGSCHQSQIVQGYGGEFVGNSRYDSRFNCHSVTITNERYEQIAASLSQAQHIALRRWEPHFVVEQEVTEIAHFRQGYDAGLDARGCIDSEGALMPFSPAWHAGYQAAQGTLQIPESHEVLADVSETCSFEHDSVAGGFSRIGQEECLTREGQQQHNALLNKPSFIEITERTHHLTLKKIARQEGADISACVTPAEKVAAILANRQKLQPA